MSAGQIRFFSLVRREVSRFMKIKRQTLGAPLLETFLYISVFGAASVLVDIPIEEPLVLIPALALVGIFFAQLGVLVGVRAEQFDDVSVYQTFVLQPLIFLGGVFYSASLLPEPFGTLTQFNPVYYMINTVRYGFLGYTEANIALSLAFLSAAALALFAINYRLFAKGYRLRA
jgi:ABC-2 type transport system permease protein